MRKLSVEPPTQASSDGGIFAASKEPWVAELRLGGSPPLQGSDQKPVKSWRLWDSASYGFCPGPHPLAGSGREGCVTLCLHPLTCLHHSFVHLLIHSSFSLLLYPRPSSLPSTPFLFTNSALTVCGGRGGARADPQVGTRPRGHTPYFFCVVRIFHVICNSSFPPTAYSSLPSLLSQIHRCLIPQ